MDKEYEFVIDKHSKYGYWITYDDCATDPEIAEKLDMDLKDYQTILMQHGARINEGESFFRNKNNVERCVEYLNKLLKAQENGLCQPDNAPTQKTDNKHFDTTNPKQLTPQAFESNDGRYRIEIEGEESILLQLTDIDSIEEGIYDGTVQNLYFGHDEIDNLIELLTKAKEMNPYSYTH